MGGPSGVIGKLLQAFGRVPVPLTQHRFGDLEDWRRGSEGERQRSQKVEQQLAALTNQVEANIFNSWNTASIQVAPAVSLPHELRRNVVMCLLEGSEQQAPLVQRAVDEALLGVGTQPGDAMALDACCLLLVELLAKARTNPSLEGWWDEGRRLFTALSLLGGIAAFQTSTSARRLLRRWTSLGLPLLVRWCMDRLQAAQQQLMGNSLPAQLLPEPPAFVTEGQAGWKDLKRRLVVGSADAQPSDNHAAQVLTGLVKAAATADPSVVFDIMGQPDLCKLGQCRQQVLSSLLRPLLPGSEAPSALPFSPYVAKGVEAVQTAVQAQAIPPLLVTSSEGDVRMLCVGLEGGADTSLKRTALALLAQQLNGLTDNAPAAASALVDALLNPLREPGSTARLCVGELLPEVPAAVCLALGSRYWLTVHPLMLAADAVDSAGRARIREALGRQGSNQQAAFLHAVCGVDDSGTARLL